MPVVHDRDARSAFPFPARPAHHGAMSVEVLHRPSTERPSSPLARRTAELRLRSRTGPLRAHVAWPEPADRPSALLVFFPQPGADAGALSRALCRLAGVVVLSAPPRSGPAEPASTAFDDAAVVVGWAADHAEELDADPGRLIVGGERAGAALAAAVTLHARDQWWPAIARQVLIHPALDAWRASVAYASSLRTAPLAGAAPATVVCGADPDDGGRPFAARLREAGVEVEELRHDGEVSALLAPLARSLRDV
jgi:acetyl esterase/lipase